MNVTIKIDGDIHIHCDYRNDCGIYDDFDEESEMPGVGTDESSELSPEETEAVIKAVADLIFPLLHAAKDD